MSQGKKTHSDTRIGALVSTRESNLGRVSTTSTRDLDLGATNIELGTGVSGSYVKSNLYQSLSFRRTQ